ncbi:EAL domain-containing protein [Dactylosporangium aurantiacum]|uniref:EAL domain-containing protein n=1 Tax=Dactylosporangium aurantiacum TaxID=35754 RepID=A0A9Q9III6_9ACTN|nr:EAL domain-containing protein [Dactylosporangium aurantiacum]MDG6105457.1 EAL domain-containing protein [Dactylosporangium aurantiacum]UWZ54004.1 EAL domain-containing protein [Dactylosporangium aurantiacum]
MPRSARLLRIMAVLVLVNTGAFGVQLVAGSRWPEPVDHLLSPFVAALAALLCGQALHASAQPWVRRFWRQSAWGMWCIAAALVLRFAQVLTGAGQLVPPLTALQSVGAALLSWAVLRIPLGLRTRAERVALALDLCTLLVAATVLLWHCFGTTALVAFTGGAHSTAGSNVGPIMGAALVAVFLGAKAALAGSERLSRRTLSWRAVAALIGGMGSAVSVLLTTRPDVDAQTLLFPLASFTTGLSAAFHLKDGAAGTRPAGRRRRYSVLPYLAVAGVDALLVYTAVADTADRLLVVAAAVVLTGLVVVRQLIAFGENDALLTRLGRQERQLRHDATHDALTGLANRALFNERVEAALRDPAGRQRVSVALVDLDDFKSVNDTLGHAVGDGLLVAVAGRMRANVRAGDTVARLGGDEFAILFQDCDGDAVDGALARIAEAVQIPVEVEGHLLVARASFGVVSAGGADLEGDLLRRADIAMYQAKALGEGGFQRYRPGMEARANQRVRLAAELAAAVDEEQFVVHYQPVVTLPDGRLTGAEALVRWQHPVRGLLGPGEFVSAAEETGLIVPLGRYVLREATREAAGWDGGRTVAVNVSARQLQREDFPADVAAALRDSGLPAHRLTVEITESTAVGGGATQDTLRELRALGVRIALDDFGTGQSTLSLLASCPVDQIKLDRSFVPGPGPDAIAGAVLQLARALGIEAVAEGVETAHQARRLHELGYTLAQGYHFGRPEPAAGTRIRRAVTGLTSSRTMVGP